MIEDLPGSINSKGIQKNDLPSILSVQFNFNNHKMLLESKEYPALPALAVPNSDEDWLLQANGSCMHKLLLHSLINVQQPDSIP